MKLKITYPMTHNNPRDSFVIEISVIRNGIDTETFEMGPFKNSSNVNNIESLLHTLQNMATNYDYDLTPVENYSTSLGYAQWFTNASTIEELRENYPAVYAAHSLSTHEDFFELSYGFSKEWPVSNAAYGIPRQVTLESYTVFYYDERGFQFAVEPEEF